MVFFSLNLCCRWWNLILFDVVLGIIMCVVCYVKLRLRIFLLVKVEVVDVLY